MDSPQGFCGNRTVRLVGKTVAERSSGCVYYNLLRRCTFMDIAVNAPVVAQSFQLQSPGLMLRAPNDNNNAFF